MWTDEYVLVSKRCKVFAERVKCISCRHAKNLLEIFTQGSEISLSVRDRKGDTHYRIAFFRSDMSIS